LDAVEPLFALRAHCGRGRPRSLQDGSKLTHHQIPKTSARRPGPGCSSVCITRRSLPPRCFRVMGGPMAFSLIMNGFALAVLVYRSRFLPRFLPQLACSLADHQRLLQSVNDLRFTIHDSRSFQGL
jgi:hypothetical protein